MNTDLINNFTNYQEFMNAVLHVYGMPLPKQKDIAEESGVQSSYLSIWKKSGQMSHHARNVGKLRSWLLGVQNVGVGGSVASQAPQPVKTKEDWISEIHTLTQLAAMEIEDTLRMDDSYGVFISGPTGVGKSWLVDQVVDEYLAENPDNDFFHQTGRMTHSGLYDVLCRNRDKPLYFEDADKVWEGEDALNLLKHVTDGSKEQGPYGRMIMERSNAGWIRELEGDFDDARSFRFSGSMVVTTNKDLRAEAASGKKNTEHLSAFLDRVNYIDLGLHNDAARLAWVGHIWKTSVVPELGLGDSDASEIWNFIEAHKNEWSQLNIRLTKTVHGKWLKRDRYSKRQLDWKQVALVTNKD